MSSPLPGIRIGHWHDLSAGTGCTVLLPAAGEMRAGVHVGGGAPGTRETDLLAPTASVQAIHALLLTGGSAFGLDAAGGVMRYLREQGIGFQTPVARVPIVPGAVIFDLDLGSPEAFPDGEAGYAAARVASDDERREGNVGAGCGATVGRMLGPAGRTKGGLGLASGELGSGIAVGVLAVVNAVGDVVGHDGTVIAGTRTTEGFAGSAELLKAVDSRVVAQPMTNTTLVAVATNARLDKVQLTRLAQLVHDGLALAISPVHTSFDGDSAFALSTGEKEGNADALGVLAVELTAAAIRRAVEAAEGLLGVPAAREMPRA
jgi:L-aminopeptidase/D-esterase-like protein